MKKLLLLSALLTSTFSFSQTLMVLEGSTISINNNSSISVDGLELAPNEAYTISGPNIIDRSNVPILGDNLYTTYSIYRTFSSKTLKSLESLQKPIKNISY